MEEFKNRLLQFIDEYCGLSVRAFEAKCGITNGTVESIKVKGPGADVVQKVALTYPELNLNWLFCERGEMVVENFPRSVATVPTAGPLIQNVFVTNFADLKGIMVEAIKESRA